LNITVAYAKALGSLIFSLIYASVVVMNVAIIDISREIVLGI